MSGVLEATVAWPSGRAQVVHVVGCELTALIAAVEAASEGTMHRYRASIH